MARWSGTCWWCSSGCSPGRELGCLHDALRDPLLVRVMCLIGVPDLQGSVEDCLGGYRSRRGLADKALNESAFASKR